MKLIERRYRRNNSALYSIYYQADINQSSPVIDVVSFNILDSPSI